MYWTETTQATRGSMAVASGPLRMAQRGGAVRMTRRGRVLLSALLVGLLVTAFSLGRVGSQAATTARATPVLQQTTVHAGETLWAVARRIAPDNDPRDVVQQLRSLNHLERASLQIGQQLLLPRRA